MPTSTDLTFITNENGNNLRERFGSLLVQNTQAFDCLVGYFYISGFYKLYPILEHVSKVRILVGLQTDRITYDLIQQAQQELPFQSHAQTRELIAKNALDELEAAPDTADVETGVRKFIEWLRSGKLEIKAYPEHNLHAKVYIMTFPDGHYDVGRVITGSSNLTQAGLQDNLEFNVELKNRADYEFAQAKFNELWATAVDVSKPIDDTINKRSLYADFTPSELYLKFLYEYFKTELNAVELDLYVPDDFKKLKYQEEAVQSAIRVLEEYNGVFLSDVVGLGKTYMAALLAQQLNGRTLVIAPPHLLDINNRGSWRNVFGDFRVPHTDFESIGKLSNLLQRDLSKYKNVFIDESHRFRTEATQSYELLAQICRGKRVILVSATPLNNSPEDILSQIKLFQNGKNSTIPNVRNLQAFFARLKANLKGLDRQQDRDEYFRIVQQNAKETRERVLKYLMIRRTRSEIVKYFGKDLQQQGMKFPEVADPQPLFYKFSKTENAVFDETIALLTQEFKYTRYEPMKYYEGRQDTHELQRQRNLTKFMKILMVKRLESSFTAFRLTLARFIHSYERMIAEYRKGYVYIGKKHINKIFDWLEMGNQEAVEELLETQEVERFEAQDFSPEFLKDLQADLKLLRKIALLWEPIRRDPKWESFRELLTTTATLRKNKLIIFTESTETAEYLAGKLAEQVEPKTLLFTGKSDTNARKLVIDNFDARAYQPSNAYRILVTTEVLAEGVNLHRSNVVVNYDIPWNPTRLIQRVGRVNRVDTSFDIIYTYNFFPTEQSNDEIKLKEAAEAKIRSFIEMLGTDARLLTDGEEIKSFDLFARLNSKKTITGEDEHEESELEYLSEIRKVRDEQKELFARIKHLPLKARSTRTLAPQTDSGLSAFPALLTYMQQGALDKFYCVDTQTSESRELDFYSAAHILKPVDPQEKRKHIAPDFYPMLYKNKYAFEVATSTATDDAASKHRGSAYDGYIMKRLRAKEIRRYHGFTDEDEVFIREVVQLLNDGAIPMLTAKKVSEALKTESEPLRVLSVLRRGIPKQFFQKMDAASDAPVSARRVVLSSYLLEAE